MDYGFTYRSPSVVALMGLPVGALLAGLFAVVGPLHTAARGYEPLSWGEYLLILGMILVSPSALLLQLLALVASCRVRVGPQGVETVAYSYFVLSRVPLAAVKGASKDPRGNGVRLRTGGRAVLLWMPDEQAEQFTEELRALCDAAKQAARCGCDRPPRSVPVDPAWLAWQDGTVPRLAQALAAERAFDSLGILADALEDAGCRDDEWLAHLRQPQPHATACWALALVASLSGEPPAG